MTLPARYVYAAIVREVHDGDTVTVDLDLGFKTWVREVTLRLFGINAPELATPAGKAAVSYLRTLLPVGAAVVVQTIKDRPDKYGGRWLGIVHSGDMVVNALLVQTGHAADWDGKGQKPLPSQPNN